MDLFKNPFSNKRENEQLTPDLVSSEKDQRSPAVEKKHFEKKEKIEQPQEIDQPSAKSPEQDKPSLKPAAPSATSAAAPKSVTLKKIENILQEDLAEVYFNLDEAHRRMFKQEGEHVALEVEKILKLGKSVTVKILEVIKKWLRLIPGINKFFIEQEAKIKTDKIIKLNQSH